jgi:hypothetical protein
MSNRLSDATPVLPVVAARALQVSAKGLRWLGDTGRIRFEKTAGSPSIRLYRWGEVVRLLEVRTRARALRMRSRLPERSAGMLKAQLRLPLGKAKTA